MNGDESEVEEVVFVELSGLIDQEWSHAAGQVCKIIGIDSDGPVLQLGRNVFSGEYADTLGTKVLFECNSKTGADTTQPDSAVLDYAVCVNKVLRMQRVFLTECENDDCKHPTDTKSTSVPAGGMEGKEASIPASSSFTMDTASVGSSDPPAAESDELTSRLQAAAVHTMDLSN